MGKGVYKRVPRAGKRKCRRCMGIWNRKRGDKSIICHQCRERCFRCDVLLTKTNISHSRSRATHRCLTCTAECVKLSTDKHDSTREKKRDRTLIRKFGITATEYDTILKAQSGGCWICGMVPLEGQNRLAVDHLHSRGENKRNPREKRGRIRGLLCWRCNRALGTFKDDITKLRKAADYLEAWPAQQVLKEKE